VLGDPRRASAAAGKAGLDAIVARTREAIERDIARH
jgi:creatinine amidohydrolase/Fe(II)-dependent formamide hydrolase-like protein